jgi:subtilase family protein
MRIGARAAVAWLVSLAGAASLAAGPGYAQAPLPRIVVAFANQPHAPPDSAATTGTRYGGEGYSISQSALRQAQSVAAAYALREVADWPIQALSMHCVVFEITDGRTVAEKVAALLQDTRVALAEPLQEFHTLTAMDTPGAPYNDPLYDLQTNLTALGIARAHQRAQGAGVRIALIDTAVDTHHPDLHGRIAHARSFVPSPAAGASLRHGTAMAGVIAAVANNHIGIVGIAPLAQVEVYQACWQLASDSDAAACNTFTLARALAAALDSRAPLVNLSLAGPADPLLAALVQSGLKRGVLFVGAASGADAPFPTAIPGVLTAGGSERPLPPGALAAPAQHVLTLRPGGEYDFESGSSVAAAEITGLLALLLSAAPGRSPGDLAALLQESAAARASADRRLVDVNAALARLDSALGSAVAVRSAH